MKRQHIKSIEQTNLLFTNDPAHDARLEQKGQWLIREAANTNHNNNNETEFTIALNAGYGLKKCRANKKQLKKFLTTRKLPDNIFEVDFANLISPTEKIISKEWIVTIEGKVKKIKPEKINLEGQILRGYLQPWGNPAVVREQMKYYAKPAVVIYRVNETNDNYNLLIIGDRTQPSNFSAHYEIAYLRRDNSLNIIKFKTFTNDPEIINKNICDFLSEYTYTLVHVPDHLKTNDEVFTELKSTQEAPKIKCGLIHLHKNKMIYPEEQIHILQNMKGTLIIALQTPSKEAREGQYLIDKQQKGPPVGGATSCEIQRILSRSDVPAFDKKWTIITGHNVDSDPTLLSGDYTFFQQPNDKKIITCSIPELTKILLQCGHKAGDQINLLLYVCNAGKSVNGEKSIAARLAANLAEQGIASTIVASTSETNRFNGKYYPEAGEIENECMKFRTDGAGDIVVVTGTPGNPPIIEEKLEQYPDGFFITSYGLGDKHTLIPHLIEATKQPKPDII